MENNKPKLILCLALVLSGALPAPVQAKFIYSTNADGVTITRYAGSGGAIVIPETIDHLPVVSIGDYAFSRQISITSVVIPDTVTNIGDEAFTYMDTHSRLTKLKLGRRVARIGRGAFSGCDQLTSIAIPDSVSSIGSGAFVFCTKLTELTIPDGVTNIGDGAFNACFSLKSITVEAGNPAYGSLDGVLYDKNRTRLLQFPGGKAGSCIIPTGVTNIAHFALWNCPYVTRVTIPEGVTSIGDEQFAACGRLETVIIPASVTNIGQNAFNSCVSMKGIYFYGNAPDYGEYWRGGRAKVLGGLDTGTVYYREGTTGWGTNFGGRPTAPWHGSDVKSHEAAAEAKVILKVASVDSEETDGQDGRGENAVDGNPNTYWHTQWQGNSPGLPHEIIIELLPPAVIKGFTYLPRQDESDHGTIKDYEFYVSDDGRHFGQPVKKGAFAPGKGEQIETFEPIKCRFIKLRAISEINGLPWTSAAEIRVIQNGEDVSVI
jgi:hypothetical protein